MTESEVREFCGQTMKSRKLSYLRMARELYISRHTLSHWIQGTSDFPLDGLIRLLDWMGYELTIRRKGGVE